MKTKIILAVIIFYFTRNLIYSQEKIPFIIPGQNKIFNRVTQDIKNNLPDNIEILIYDINLLNGTKLLSEEINNKFRKILAQNHLKCRYNFDFINEYSEEQIGITLDKLKKLSDMELISLGKDLDKEAVLLSTITLVEDKRRKIWNKETKEFNSKKIALFQGNFFSTINNNSLYRFSYYFLVD